MTWRLKHKLADGRELWTTEGKVKAYPFAHAFNQSDGTVHWSVYKNGRTETATGNTTSIAVAKRLAARELSKVKR